MSKWYHLSLSRVLGTTPRPLISDRWCHGEMLRHSRSSLNPMPKNWRFWAKTKGEETERLCPAVEILRMVSVSIVHLGFGHR